MKNKYFWVLFITVFFGMFTADSVFAQVKNQIPKRSVMFKDLLANQKNIAWNQRRNIVKREAPRGSSGVYSFDNIQFKFPATGEQAKIAEAPSATRSQYGSNVEKFSLTMLKSGTAYTIRTPGTTRLEVLVWSDVKEFPWLNWHYFRFPPNSSFEFTPGKSGSGTFKFTTSIYNALEWDLGFENEIATREFMYILARSVDRDKVRKEVNTIKAAFNEAAKDPKTKGKCIPRIAGVDAVTSASALSKCNCKGDALKHIINIKATESAVTGSIATLEPASLPGVFSDGLSQYLIHAQLAYHVACFYGRFPTYDQFMRECYVLFSNVNPSTVKVDTLMNMPNDKAEGFLTEYVPKVLASIVPKGFVTVANGIAPTIPVATKAFKLTLGFVVNRNNAIKFADRAIILYKK